MGIHRRRAELDIGRDSDMGTRAAGRTMVIDQRSHSNAVHEESIVEILYAVLFDARDRREFFEFHISLERESHMDVTFVRVRNAFHLCQRGYNIAVS